MDIGVSPAAPAVARRHPGKGTRCLDAAVCLGLPGSLPDEFDFMQRVDHGIEPARLDPCQTRHGSNPPRGHVSET